MKLIFNIEEKFIRAKFVEFFSGYDERVHAAIKSIKKLDKLDNQKILNQIVESVKTIEKEFKSLAKEGK